MESRLVGTGINEAIAGMERLGKEAVPVMRKVIRKGLVIYQKSIQAAVPEARTQGHSAVNIRNAIGIRTVSKGGSIVEAKVGANVNKKQPRQRFAKGESDEDFIARRNKIKPINLAHPAAHLLALGTADRSTGYTTRRKVGADGKKVNHDRTGHRYRYTGRIIAYPFVKLGVAAKQAAVENQMALWLKEYVDKELAKRGAV